MTINNSDNYLNSNPNSNSTSFTAAMASIGLLITNIGSSTISQTSSGSFWGLFNFVRFLYYFIYINMDIPLNFYNFLHYFHSLMFPLPNMTENIFITSGSKLSWNSLPDQIPPKKFENENLSSLFFTKGLDFFAYLIITIIFTLFVEWRNNYLIKKNMNHRKFWLLFKQEITWNFTLRFILISITPLSLSLFLQFYKIDFTDPISATSITIAIITTLLILGGSFFMTRSILKPRGLNQTENFMQSHKPLTEDYVNETSKVAKCFSMVIFWRKILISANVVLLYYYTICNLSLLIFQSLGISALAYKYQPFKKGRMNILLIYEGIILSIISCVLIIMYRTQPNEEGREKCGIFLITLAAGLMLGYLVNFLYDIIVTIKRNCDNKKIAQSKKKVQHIARLSVMRSNIQKI